MIPHLQDEDRERNERTGRNKDYGGTCLVTREREKGV